MLAMTAIISKSLKNGLELPSVCSSIIRSNEHEGSQQFVVQLKHLLCRCWSIQFGSNHNNASRFSLGYAVAEHLVITDFIYFNQTNVKFPSAERYLRSDAQRVG